MLKQKRVLESIWAWARRRRVQAPHQAQGRQEDLWLSHTGRAQRQLEVFQLQALRRQALRQHLHFMPMLPILARTHEMKARAMALRVAAHGPQPSSQAMLAEGLGQQWLQLSPACQQHGTP